MKKALLIIILTFLGIYINAQDMLIMKDGEKRIVLIKKVGLETIEYVRYDSKRNPMYEVNKNEVHKIIYHNGTEDVFQTLVIPEQDQLKEGQKSGAFIDPRDNASYKFVVIGKQTWMAENLKFINGKSPCASNKQNICSECGNYYSYTEAIVACPTGWHLPSDQDWMILENEVGMSLDEANKSGWRGTGPGQSPLLEKGGNTGFDLLLCGYYSMYKPNKAIVPLKDITDLNNEGYYWTSTNANKYKAYYRSFSSVRSINRGLKEKVMKYSVRCVKD